MQPRDDAQRVERAVIPLWMPVLVLLLLVLVLILLLVLLSRPLILVLTARCFALARLPRGALRAHHSRHDPTRAASMAAQTCITKRLSHP